MVSEANYLNIPDSFCQVIGNPSETTVLWELFFDCVLAMPEMIAVGRRDDGYSFEYILFFEGVEYTEVSRRIKGWEGKMGIHRGPGGYIHHV